jgi:hypothetical protein
MDGSVSEKLQFKKNPKVLDKVQNNLIIVIMGPMDHR